ncbi:hypothetical protein [Candidatus Ruminimicrobiellum ovillum]|uniref:hypothetical protein n=1 Tax=Candidatus Ruminimicrobiellum ovillum TaxID=1947927 RepID=UPI0035596A5F
MKKILNIINNKSGQAAVEYVLFTLVMFAASYGMVKLFVLAWKHKFEFVSFIMGVSNVLF